jgi:hypothetical protein
MFACAVLSIDVVYVFTAFMKDVIASCLFILNSSV